jgi:hypothetical protein
MIEGTLPFTNTQEHKPVYRNDMKRLSQIRPFWLAAALAIQPMTKAVAQVSYVNFEGKQSNPVRLSPDGTRLFAVNTPDARLSVFDVSNPSNPILVAEIPVGIEPVSVNPRSNDEACGDAWLRRRLDSGAAAGQA